MRVEQAVVVAVLMFQPVLPGVARSGEPPPAAREAAALGTDILNRVMSASAARAAALASYQCRRHYAVLERGHDPDAEMVVSMQFVPPSTKTFSTVTANGVGWIHRRVFMGLMHAEQEAAGGAEQAASAISTRNYDAQLIGSDRVGDREAYVLALTPRRRDKYLFAGKVWIDKEDLAVARIEGEPARSPSFWVIRAPFVRQYQRIDRFWLPKRDETHSQIRFAGEYILQIDYDDYNIAHTA